MYSFQFRDRSTYRSRSGFSQTDGIAQFAGSFLRNSRRGVSATEDRSLDVFDFVGGGFERLGLGRHQLSHTAPASQFAGRSAPVGRHLDESSTSVAWHVSTSPVWRKAAPVTRKRAFGRTIYDEDDNDSGFASRRALARRRRPAGRKPTVMLQNFMVTNYDDDIKAGVMATSRARSRRISPGLDRLVEQEVRQIWHN
jgi:hypothetical protein